MDLTALRSETPDHWNKAAAIRALTLDAVAGANSGHSGMPIGMADVATVLFEKHMKFDITAPKWADRDRFILSAGHGSMLIYSLLYLMGDAQVTLDQIKNFRQSGALTAGHPENFLLDAVEVTTGPLGQGISNAVGFAMAEESLRAHYGKKVVDHYTYVIAGDSCLMEGISQEAIGLAGRHQLGKLVVFWDNNNITIDGTVDLSDRTNQVQRFKASGWHVQEIDGHNPAEIDAAIEAAKKTKKPSMIACKTHIALGHAAQDTSKGHGALTDADQLKAAKDAYGWTGGAYDVPAEIKSQWEEIGKRGAAARAEWEGRFAELSSQKQDRFNRAFALEAPKKLSATIKALKKQISESQPKVATRKASEMALEVINPIMPETIGGSADLTGSNNTKTGDLGVFDTDNRKGRYVYWGIREHGMAAAMNGMALHGGIRPYGGTFFCFTDYARPAMRLAALSKIPTVFVMTHDSIGVGEDGPTHQPVEHLASLGNRADLEGDPVGDRPDPSGAAHRTHRAQAVEPHRERRLCAGRGRKQASGDPDGVGFRGLHRDGRKRHPRRSGHRHPCCLCAVYGAVPRSGRGLPPQGSARRSGARGHRGRRTRWRLGSFAAGRTWSGEKSGLCRHAGLWCLCPGGRAV